MGGFDRGIYEVLITEASEALLSDMAEGLESRRLILPLFHGHQECGVRPRASTVAGRSPQLVVPTWRTNRTLDFVIVLRL